MLNRLIRIYCEISNIRGSVVLVCFISQQRQKKNMAEEEKNKYIPLSQYFMKVTCYIIIFVTSKGNTKITFSNNISCILILFEMLFGQIYTTCHLQT